MWKHLNSLPTSKSKQALAKHITGALNMFYAHVTLFIFTLISIAILRLVRHDAHLESPLSLILIRDLSAMFLRCYFASLVSVVIMIFVSSRFRSVGPPVFFYIFGFSLANVGKITAAPFLPWSIPILWYHSLSSLPWKHWWLLPWTIWILIGLILHTIMSERKPFF